MGCGRIGRSTCFHLLTQQTQIRIRIRIRIQHQHQQSTTTPMLNQLNPEQLTAVTLPVGHALILAGAGSGKTKVLTTRMAWLLQTGQTTTHQIMAVTFTNKAAKEMLTRLTTLVPFVVRGMWMGTFHGLCNRMLRAHHVLARLPSAFQILDTQDQLSAIKRLCKQFNVDDTLFPPKQLQWYISAQKEEGKRPSDIQCRDAKSIKMLELYGLYEAQCQREGVVDFGELMLRSFELLQDHPNILVHYQQRFQHILVDEFQDTNRLQYAWLKLLAGHPQSSIMAVGDDDQSIYAFRGARVGNMADFVSEFQLPAHRQIKLEENYRSDSNILHCANVLIENNTKRLGKNLRTNQEAGEKVRIRQSHSDHTEASSMVEEIQAILQTKEHLHKEIAILYRSNAQSRLIESALFNVQLPYRVHGGLRFFERAEVKHALAYLRLIENLKDDTSFLRVVNFPARGIGARSLEQLQDMAHTHNTALCDAVQFLTGKAATLINGFVAKIHVLKEVTCQKPLHEIIQILLQHSGLLAHYQAERDGQDRVDNLQELTNAAASFNLPELDPEASDPTNPLTAFLNHAALEAGDNQALANQDAIQLMTVHAAKGLEFDCVFIAGLEEGLFPHDNAKNTADGVEEERRLMYVAITRARKRLYISHAQSRMLHGQHRNSAVSRFIGELPTEAIKNLTASHTLQRTHSIYPMQSHRFQSVPIGNDSRNANSTINTATATTNSTSTRLTVGNRVFHAKFGEGKVLMFEGESEQAKVQIDFPRHGIKWLSLAIAKLTLID